MWQYGFEKMPALRTDIKDDEKYCNVCRREMKGGDSEPEDSIVMCSECGENPAVKGSDLCAICLREARRQEMQSGNVAEPITDPEELVLGSVGLDEIEVPMPSDSEIPESELTTIWMTRKRKKKQSPSPSLNQSRSRSPSAAGESDITQ